MSLADFRNEYDKFDLPDNQLPNNPLDLFNQWLDEAIRLKAPEPTAMSLSTVNAEGMPSSRIVLLKGFDENGVHFYTNYDSHKGKDLTQNPKACLLFFWPTLQRQIRIEGSVIKMATEQSVAYFNSRPLPSRISALVSPQSQPISRVELERLSDEIAEKHGEHPPCPDFWGGYYLQPERIEFWQGRTCRLHDRYLYEKQDNTWRIQRLAP